MEKDSICSSDWANVGMIIISYQSDGLAILPVILDSEGDFEFHREFLRLTVKTLNVDDSTFAVKKIQSLGMNALTMRFPNGYMHLSKADWVFCVYLVQRKPVI